MLCMLDNRISWRTLLWCLYFCTGGRGNRNSIDFLINSVIYTTVIRCWSASWRWMQVVSVYKNYNNFCLKYNNFLVKNKKLVFYFLRVLLFKISFNTGTLVQTMLHCHYLICNLSFPSGNVLICYQYISDNIYVVKPIVFIIILNICFLQWLSFKGNITVILVSFLIIIHPNIIF